MSVQSEDAARVGRPRDPSVERRVLEAARQELAENGVEGFSVRSVARRAEVSRPSLNLRWPDADSLIVDALDDINPREDIAPTGSLHGDLAAVLAQIADVMGSPLIELQMRLVADARRHPELLTRFQQRVMGTEFERIRTVLRRAVEVGEAPPDVDAHLFVDTVVGIIFMRTIASPGRIPPGPKARDTMVSDILRLFTRR